MGCFVRGADTELNPEAQVRTGYRRTEKDVHAVGHASVTDMQLVTVGAPVRPSEQRQGSSREDPGSLHRKCCRLQASLCGKSQGLALNLCLHSRHTLPLKLNLHGRG